MATENQIFANRLNAKKSTGPKTAKGKLRSRENAIRHGLTAETIIGVLENAHDYEAFEAAIVLEYQPQTTVAHELVARLASLLWRLRRATAIESGLFQIQGKLIRRRQLDNRAKQMQSSGPLKLFHNILRDAEHTRARTLPSTRGEATEVAQDQTTTKTRLPRLHVANCFLRLANLDNDIFGRISRYEASLWRQVAQTMLVLDSINTVSWRFHSDFQQKNLRNTS